MSVNSLGTIPKSLFGVPNMSPAISFLRGKTSLVKQVLPGLPLEAAGGTACFWATQLGTYAAQVAQRLGVGIELDYETNTGPNLTALQLFTSAYRAIEFYDATCANPATRLTINLALFDLEQGRELRGQLMSQTGAFLLR